MQLTIDNAAFEANRFLSDCPHYSGKFDGRGIVTCGGGIKYGTCAWVLVRLLRHLGCRLPIEVWSLNDDEFDPQWAELVKPLGVTCRNAAMVVSGQPKRRLRGWELKPFSILHSRFREVLFLDADNVPIVDPSFLFEEREFKRTGTIFWPDPEHFTTPPDSQRWKAFGVPYRPGPDQESGQLLVDKARCWRALQLCNWYNRHSDFYYQHVYGDKDTFRFAWQRLEQPISWAPQFPDEKVLFTLRHFDLDGRLLFQHRFYRKWSLYEDNTGIPGFQHEKICMQFIDELRRQWQPQRHLMRAMTDTDRQRMGRLIDQRFLYNRPGHNRWNIRLGANGFIDEGQGPNEFFWWCENGQLTLAGTDGRRKCQLRPTGDGGWVGVCQRARNMRIELHRLSAQLSVPA